MANTVLITKLLDGPKHAIIHVFLESDGASGELVDQVLIDPTQLVPTGSAVPSFTLEGVWHSFNGFAGKIEFDSVVDTSVWVFTENETVHTCFADFGGLKDRSNPLDGSGKLLLSTVGFTAAGDMGSMVIKVRKD